MDLNDVKAIVAEEIKYETWQCNLPFNLSFNSSDEPVIIDLLEYVNHGWMAINQEVITHTIEHKYPG